MMDGNKMPPNFIGGTIMKNSGKVLKFAGV
jgi:hypothetical protein